MCFLTFLRAEARSPVEEPKLSLGFFSVWSRFCILSKIPQKWVWAFMVCLIMFSVLGRSATLSCCFCLPPLVSPHFSCCIFFHSPSLVLILPRSIFQSAGVESSGLCWLGRQFLLECTTHYPASLSLTEKKEGRWARPPAPWLTQSSPPRTSWFSFHCLSPTLYLVCLSLRSGFGFWWKSSQIHSGTKCLMVPSALAPAQL